MATQPTGTYAWATVFTNNGPTLQGNRINVPTEYQDVGYIWNDKPPYEVMNGWMYNVGQWLDYIQETQTETDLGWVAGDANLQSQIDALDLTAITGTSSDSYTVGTGLGITPKYIYTGNTDEGAGAGYLVWRLSPEFSEINPNTGLTNIPWKWWARDNSYAEEYPLTALTTDDLAILENNLSEGVITAERFNQLSAFVVYSQSEISGLALTEILQYHSGVESYTVDVRYIGNTTATSAKNAAAAQVSGQQEGDILTVIWYKERRKGMGNWTKILSDTTVSTYTYTNGSWV